GPHGRPGPGPGPGLGLGLGERVILRAAKEWHIKSPRGHARLVVDVADIDAVRTIGALRAKYPELDRVAEIRPRDGDPAGPGLGDLDRGTWTQEQDQDGGLPEAALVCLAEEAAALVVADRLRRMLPAPVPIVVRTIESAAGLGALLQGRAGEG